MSVNYLKNIDYYILMAVKEMGRTSPEEVYEVISPEEGWTKSYIKRQLSVLVTAGLLQKPTRGLYEITREGKEIVKNTKITIGKPEIDTSEHHMLRHLTRVDKRILQYLNENLDRPHRLVEIADGIRVKGERHYATTVSRRLNILQEAGITDTEGHDQHVITDEGIAVYETLKSRGMIPSK